MNLNIFDIGCYSAETIGMVLTIPIVHKLDKPFKLFGIQIILGFIMDVCCGLPSAYLHYQSVWLYNIYLFVEFALVNSAVIIWVKNSTVKKIIRVAIFLVLLSTVFHLWHLPNDTFTNNMLVPYLFNSLVFIYLIFEQFRTNELVETKDPVLWLLFLKLLFFVMQVPALSVPRGSCAAPNSIYTIANNINALANVLHYIGTGICLVIIYKKNKPLQKIQPHV